MRQFREVPRAAVEALTTYPVSFGYGADFTRTADLAVISCSSEGALETSGDEGAGRPRSSASGRALPRYRARRSSTSTSARNTGSRRFQRSQLCTPGTFGAHTRVAAPLSPGPTRGWTAAGALQYQHRCRSTRDQEPERHAEAAHSSVSSVLPAPGVAGRKCNAGPVHLCGGRG